MNESIRDYLGKFVLTSDRYEIGLTVNAVVNKDNYECSLLVMPGLFSVDIGKLPRFGFLRPLFNIFSKKADTVLEDKDLGIYIEAKDNIVGWLLDYLKKQEHEIRNSWFQIPVSALGSVTEKRVQLNIDRDEARDKYYLLSPIEGEDAAYYSHEIFARNWNRDINLDLGLPSVRHALITDAGGDRERLMDLVIVKDKGVCDSFVVEIGAKKVCVPTHGMQCIEDPSGGFKWITPKSFTECPVR
jgi:hypothetical protein